MERLRPAVPGRNLAWIPVPIANFADVLDLCFTHEEIDFGKMVTCLPIQPRDKNRIFSEVFHCSLLSFVPALPQGAGTRLPKISKQLMQERAQIFERALQTLLSGEKANDAVKIRLHFRTTK